MNAWLVQGKWQYPVKFLGFHVAPFVFLNLRYPIKFLAFHVALFVFLNLFTGMNTLVINLLFFSAWDCRPANSVNVEGF